jgi:hypothetical protein
VAFLLQVDGSLQQHNMRARSNREKTAGATL